MNEKIKRPRSANWVVKEKTVLKELIKPYFKVLANRSLFCSANEAKKKAWRDITNKYNSICTMNKRSTNQLKVQWKKLKRIMTKDMMATDSEVLTSISLSPQSQETVDSVQEYECFKVESVDYITDSEEVENPLDESNSITETIIPCTSQQENNTKIQVSVEVLNNFKEATTQTTNYTNTNGHKRDKSESSIQFSEAFHEDMRYYREIENNRLEKEHLLRVRTMKEQHTQFMKNLLLQEEILKRQLKKMD